MLKSQSDGNFYGRISFDCSNCQSATTTNQNPGTLVLTEFNTNSNIVSATFEFTVIDPETGTIYEITDGRFDAVFTQ